MFSLSEAIKRNIYQVGAGRIFNRLNFLGRRSVLFFEDILSEYIKFCETHGKENEISAIFREWAAVCTYTLIPSFIRKLPLSILSKTIGRAWVHIGILDGLDMNHTNSLIRIKTRNEMITRVIGRNNAVIEMYAGSLSTTYGEKNQKICVKQGKISEYLFSFSGKPYIPHSRSKGKYYKLNGYETMGDGISLKECVSRKLIIIDGNRVLLKGKRLITLENTIIHMLGNERIFLDELNRISYNYFRKMLSIKTESQCLFTLKMIFQSIGFGAIDIISDENKIVININNPSYSLKAPDNWDFLAHVMLGYLWMIDKSIKYDHCQKGFRKISMVYKKQE